MHQENIINAALRVYRLRKEHPNNELEVFSAYAAYEEAFQNEYDVNFLVVDHSYMYKVFSDCFSDAKDAEDFVILMARSLENKVEFKKVRTVGFFAPAQEEHDPTDDFPTYECTIL